MEDVWLRGNDIRMVIVGKLQSTCGYMYLLQLLSLERHTNDRDLSLEQLIGSKHWRVIAIARGSHLWLRWAGVACGKL